MPSVVRAFYIYTASECQGAQYQLSHSHTFDTRLANTQYSTMSYQASKDPPPAYDAPSASQSTRLINSAQHVVEQERNVEAANSVEVARLRRFLVYCLCVDYRHAVPTELSSEDTQHFVNLGNTICYLDASHEAALKDCERTQLSAYLWRFVHQPCSALQVPAECAITIVLRFIKYQSSYAAYKGSAYGVLHTHGLERLAHKIWQDCHVLIPRLLPQEARTAMNNRVNQLATIYFENIRGVEGSITRGDWDIGFEETQSIAYSLTARGRRYNSSRYHGTETAKQGPRLSPSHLFARLLQCLPGLNKRRDVFPSTPGHPVSEPEVRKKKFLSLPSSWTFHETAHIPDLFEDRGLRYQCDL